MDKARVAQWGVVLALTAVAACSEGASVATTDHDVVTTTALATTDDVVVTMTPVDPPTPLETSSPAAAAVAVEDADFGWALDGDGSARSGGVDVILFGAFAASDEAVSFDGYTGHAVTPGPGPGPVDTTESFTLTAWANYADQSSSSAVLGLLGADSYAAAISVGDDEQWVFATKTQDLTGVEHAVLVKGGPALAGNTWTHLAGVYDADAGSISFFVNGAFVGESATGPLFDAQGPLTIGRGQFDGGPGNYWPGAIGDVAVFQRALGAEQIGVLYEATKPSSSAPPMPAPDPSTYGDGILNGTWDYVYVDEDAQVFIDDFADYVDDADEVIVRIGFDDHEFWIGFLFDGVMPMNGSSPEGAGGTITIEDDILTSDEGAGATDSRFTLDGNELTLEFLRWCESDGTCTEVADPIHLLVINHTFTKSSDDPRKFER